MRIYDLKGKKEGSRSNAGGEVVEGRDEDVDLLWERIGAECGAARKNPSDRNGITEDLSGRNSVGGRLTTIMEHVSATLAPGNYLNIATGYLQTTGALHFLFRLIVSIRHYRTDNQTGVQLHSASTHPSSPPSAHPPSRAVCVAVIRNCACVYASVPPPPAPPWTPTTTK